MAESTDGWLTKAEAGEALGVTTKTIEKYVQQGKLHQAMQAQINKPARAVIDPEDIEKMLSERSQTQALSVREPSANRSSLALEPLLEAFSRRIPLTDLAVKLWLTEDEAVAYSGIGIGHLQTLVEWRRIGPRGAKVCRRKDIEAV